MTEETQYHVPITKNQEIRPSAPKITAPSWDPSAGAARQQQIEEARQEQLEESRRAASEQLPHNLRITALEGVVSRLVEDVKMLKANNAQL